MDRHPSSKAGTRHSQMGSIPTIKLKALKENANLQVPSKSCLFSTCHQTANTRYQMAGQLLRVPAVTRQVLIAERTVKGGQPPTKGQEPGVNWRLIAIRRLVSYVNWGTRRKNASTRRL